jgi:hypothetical protein
MPDEELKKLSKMLSKKFGIPEDRIRIFQTQHIGEEDDFKVEDLTDDDIQAIEVFDFKSIVKRMKVGDIATALHSGLQFTKKEDGSLITIDKGNTLAVTPVIECDKYHITGSIFESTFKKSQVYNSLKWEKCDLTRFLVEYAAGYAVKIGDLVIKSEENEQQANIHDFMTALCTQNLYCQA